MTSRSHEAFRLTLNMMLKEKGRGSQSWLAKEVDLHRSNVSDIIKGRRKVSTEVQERIAAVFALSLGEFLRIGEAVLKGRSVFPWSDQIANIPDRKDQALKIIELTNMQKGYPQDNVRIVKLILDFLNGETSPNQLYSEYSSLIESRQKK